MSSEKIATFMVNWLMLFVFLTLVYLLTLLIAQPFSYFADNWIMTLQMSLMLSFTCCVPQLRKFSVVACIFFFGVLVVDQEKSPNEIKREIAAEQEKKQQQFLELVEKKENQERCKKILSQVQQYINSNQMIELSRYGSQVRSQISVGLNEGCSELRTGLHILRTIYEDGIVPAPIEFERAGRFFYRAQTLLNNPKLKLENL